MRTTRYQTIVKFLIDRKLCLQIYCQLCHRASTYAAERAAFIICIINHQLSITISSSSTFFLPPLLPACRCSLLTSSSSSCSCCCWGLGAGRRIWGGGLSGRRSPAAECPWCALARIMGTSRESTEEKQRENSSIMVKIRPWSYLWGLLERLLCEGENILHFCAVQW